MFLLGFRDIRSHRKKIAPKESLARDFEADYNYNYGN